MESLQKLPLQRSRPRPPTSDPQWLLYLLECSRGGVTSLYAGITNDLPARMAAHASGKGAKYTRANKPLRVVATRAFCDRAAASSAEWSLKQQPRARKLAFLATLGATPFPPEN